MRPHALLAFASTLLCACSPGGGADWADGVDGVAALGGKADGSDAVCQKQSIGADADGDQVVRCEQAFAEAPLVRPAADVLQGSKVTSMFVGLIDGGYGIGAEVVDRAGKAYVLVDSSGKSIGGFKDGHIPAGFKMPSNRFVYLVYRVAGSLSSVTIGGNELPAMHVTKAAPAVLLTGQAIDSTLLGAWEGTVSQRTSSSRFDAEQTLPLRLSFGKLTKMSAAMKEWDGDSTLPDGTRYTVSGTLENAQTGVLGADGRCIAALSDAGAANPFSGASDDQVALNRDPGMHFAGDTELVLTYPSGTPGLTPTGMGNLTVAMPAALIQTMPAGDFAEVTLHPHGPPSGHQVTLHRVSGGGGACN
jgi:hypothetical protein